MNMKVKLAVLVLTLLLGSIFAGAFVFADSDLKNKNFKRINVENAKGKAIAELQKGKTVSLDEIKDIEIDEATKAKIQETIDSYKKNKIGFSTSYRGTGHITNDESGYLIAGFWTIQKFAEADSDSVNERGFGNLKIAHNRNLHLIMKDNSDEEVSFYVLLNKDSKDLDSAEDEAVGTLVLNVDKNLENLVVWSGELSLQETDLEGEWSVSMATDKFVVRPKQIPKDKFNLRIKVNLEDFDKESCLNISVGDANVDGKVDISDSVFIGMALRGQEDLECSHKADVNADALVNQEDIEYLLNYLFKGGSDLIESNKEDISDKLEALGDKIPEADEEGTIDLGEDVKVKDKQNPKLNRGFWQRFKNFFKF